MKAFKDHIFLKLLDLKSSHITDDVAIDVATIVVNNFALKHFKLSHISLQEKGFKVLSKHLGMITCLKQFCLNNVDVAYSKAEVIATCIRHNNGISHLDMSGCNISENGISTILAELMNVQSLKQFKFNDFITNDSSTSFCDIIANNTELIHIEIARCELQDNCFQKFVDAFPFCLEHLDISGNTISNNVALKLAGYLMKSIMIKHLNFSNCALTDKGAQLIFDSLQSCNSLMHFDVSHNSITDEASHSLAKALSNNTTLQFFSVCNCKLSEVSRLCIIEALKKLTGLINIDSSNNYMVFQLTATLAEVLMNNSKLENVDLEGTKGLAKSGNVNICKELKGSELSKHLGLNISSQIARLFTSLFMSNKKMIYFGLPFTKLSNTTLSVMFDSIAANLSALTALNLSSCIVDGSLVNYLEAAITSNKMLKTLSLNKVCLSQNGFYILHQYFSIIYNLCSAEFNGVTVTSLSAQSLASLLCNNRDLKLSIKNCVVAVELYDIICNALEDVRKLQRLNFNFTLINDESANKIAAVIANKTYLEHIEMAGYSMSEVAFVKVIGAMGINISRLQCINLSSNAISHNVSLRLGKLLKQSTIKKIIMSNTQLEEDGLTAIVESLQNAPIKCVDISYNKIAYKSACSIVDMITSSSSLEQLDLSDCALAEMSTAKIASAFKGLTSLKHLSMKFDSDDTAKEIASVILNNSKLEYLNLASCNLQDKGLLAVLNASSKITRLKYFGINVSYVSTNIIKSIINTLCCSSNLEHFELYGEIPENDIINIIKQLQENSSLNFLNITSHISITKRKLLKLLISCMQILLLNTY